MAKLGYLDARALDLAGHPDGATLDEPEDHLDDILMLEQVNSAFMAGRKDEAIRLTRALLQRMPKSVVLHEQLAATLLTIRTPEALDEAERHLHQALALDFRRSKNHYNLGLVAMRRMVAAEAKGAREESEKQRAAAIDSFRLALELDATAPEALANLAGLLQGTAQRLPPEAAAERGKLAREAVALYDRLLAVIPSGHADRARITAAREEAQKMAEANGVR
jgi:tetratricopeptide (TPR) repeat protein